MRYEDCHECRQYADARREVIAGPMARRAEETGETNEEILNRYMDGVHARHLSGLPILPSAAA